jgi:hypothetical protein
MRAKHKAEHMVLEAQEKGQLAKKGQPKKSGDVPRLIDAGISHDDRKDWKPYGKVKLSPTTEQGLVITCTLGCCDQNAYSHSHPDHQLLSV